MKTFSFKVFSEGISFKSYDKLKFYGIPEICFTGRSNVGKSSLINAITNRKSLASDFLFVMALISEDLPTFDLPVKHISGIP